MFTFGVSVLIGNAMIKVSGRYDIESCSTLAKEFSAPVQVITAGKRIF